MKTIIRNPEQQIAYGLRIQSSPFVGPIVIETKPYKSTRSLEQNAKLWAILQEISAQVVLTQEGYKLTTEAQGWTRRLTAEDWKDIFTASLKRQDTVPGIDAGFVLIGSSTSKMTVMEMMDLITLIEAFGAEKGVIFKDD